MNGSNSDKKVDATEHAGVRAKVEGDIVRIERSAVGMVRAEHVELRTAGAGLVVASNDVSIQGGGARDIIAGGAVRVTGGGAGALIAGGPTTIENGLVVFAFTPKIELGNGGRVLFGPLAAVAVIAVAAVGALLVRKR